MMATRRSQGAQAWVRMALTGLGVMLGGLSATGQPRDNTPFERATSYFQVCIWPPVQLFAENEHVKGLRLSLLGGRNYTMAGLDVAAGLSFVEDDAAGLQVAGAGIVGEGRVRGCQMAFGVSNADEFRGWQMAGLGSLTEGDFYGIQLGGWLAACGSLPFDEGGDDRTRGSLTGIQFAGVGSVRGDLTGVQIGAGGGVCYGSLRGLQVGSIGSICCGSLDGVQATGGILGSTVRQSLRGAQVGCWSYADEVAGLQFGFVNVCRTLAGVQIGLINISKEHRFPILPLLNVRF